MNASGWYVTSQHSTASFRAARPGFRLAVLMVAGLELGLVLWLVLRSDILETDWSRPLAVEVLWLPGIFGVLSGVAFLLAAFGRGLGWAVALCMLYAILAAFFLSIAQVATVAG